MTRPLNPDYAHIGGRYKHIAIWEAHHGRKTPSSRTSDFIIHHKNEDKNDNIVCRRRAPCPNLRCGNLELMTRADHIRSHKPGRMGKRKGPNVHSRLKTIYTCPCGNVKSKNGDVCRSCYLHELAVNRAL